MISVILYGRNDAHGYNLHRRAALSLNCLAEVLTDPDDEIVFVDYNTPDELPTFIEAIGDTLTERCLDLLRVFRVPAALHQRRFARLTHLPALEPVARNAAVRRADPANRWVLSTNTDMLLIPLTDESLSDVCRDLPDGFYGLPRFELPEWLWERLPRSDPERAMAEVGRLGPRLHLDEATLSHEWIRFDAPGDFQLVLREDLVAIDGFDEAMLRGWHVDSNLSRRMVLQRGSIESLADRFAGYHCNHSRTPTVYHGAEWTANDLDRFFESVERAEVPSQRETWGLSDIALEEVPVGRSSVDLARALASAIPPPEGPKAPVDTSQAALALTYDPAHVLPFLADAIAVSPRHATIGYLGANPVLEEMLARLVGELDVARRLTFVVGAEETGVRALEEAELLIVDFGLNAAHLPSGEPQRNEDLGPMHPPRQLHAVIARLARFVELERRRLERGEHPRRLVFVNSATAFLDPYVRSEFDLSATTFHSRVRRAVVRRTPSTPRPRLARDLRFVERLELPREPLVLRLGESIQFSQVTDFGGFGEGWAIPDPETIWTEGDQAELLLACPDARDGRHIFSLTFGRVGVPPGDRLPVSLLIDGHRVASRSFAGGINKVRWCVPMPSTALAKERFDVVLEIAGRGIWVDDRRLGLHVWSFDVRRDGFRRRFDDSMQALRTRLAHLRQRVHVTRLRF